MVLSNIIKNLTKSLLIYFWFSWFLSLLLLLLLLMVLHYKVVHINPCRFISWCSDIGRYESFTCIIRPSLLCWFLHMYVNMLLALYIIVLANCRWVWYLSRGNRHLVSLTAYLRWDRFINYWLIYCWAFANLCRGSLYWYWLIDTLLLLRHIGLLVWLLLVACGVWLSAIELTWIYWNCVHIFVKIHIV